MKELLVDIGNTRIKMADWDGVLLSHYRDSAYDGHDIHELLTHTLTGTTDYQAVSVASVASEMANQALYAWFEDNTTARVSFVHSSAQALGVMNGYVQADALGVDRWLAMIAAYHLSNTAVCVADCGSALTVDLLDHQGRHQGGMIVPGRRLQLAALGKRLARLSIPDDAVETTTWGKNTGACMVSGSLVSLAGTIAVAMREAERCFGTMPRLILTGGDAPKLGYYLHMPYEWHQHLVLQGLALLSKEQKKED